MASLISSLLRDSAVLSAQAQASLGRACKVSYDLLLPENVSTAAHSLRDKAVKTTGPTALVEDLWQNATSFNLVSYILLLLVLRAITIVIHRLYFHPLAKFPGPKFAAISRLYEFWYQGIKLTEFPEKVKALHQIYGPIVRISPFELSLNDSKFNVEYFGKDRNLDKDPWYYGFGFANSLFTLLDKPKHRERQAHLASHFSGPYFSQAGPLLADEVQALCGEFETSVKTSNTLNLSLVYRKAGNEILRTFLLGQHGASTDSEDYAKDAKTAYHPLFRAMTWIRHFKFLFKMRPFIPIWVFDHSLPLARFEREASQHIRDLIEEHDKSGEPEKDDALLYRLIAQDPTYRDDKATAAVEEFMELQWGGREVMGHALTNISYHLTANPQCMEKLHEELKHADLDVSTAPFGQLQKVRYLHAVCKEGIRMQLGGGFRIPRINNEPVQYRDWIIPANTPVSMSPNFFHYDGAIFPEPFTFKPERWLQPDAEALEHYWKPFGNGSRSCAGRNMALEVIWRSVANVFSTYKTEFDGIDAEFCKTEGMLKAFPHCASLGLTVSVKKY